MAIFDAFWRAVLKIKTKSDTEKLTKFHAIRRLRSAEQWSAFKST